ncbi:hypothetical protein BS50DRAFT_296990 [Corynespora cassiicola Philippines]|uniref:MARVEL domain-containing protein n=1 Tax=Corynespora cassiicola Philippines TaxID=1448308 RepID=A0A2T2NWP5_CORCC|nr:hypothetical protein BS50DRAFT_296990 [Corynespora cassiicola Philippines]
MATQERSGNVPPIPKWTLGVYAAAAVFAVVILGLDAYGIRWIPYNALIYSLAVAICTLGVCAYVLGTQLFLHKFYNPFVSLGLHIWMCLFWIVDLGLVANLARLWAGMDCSYDYWYGYYCTYGKRDLHSIAKRDTTTYKTYYGALAAGAFFAAAQFGIWVLGTFITFMYMNKRRAQNASNPQTHPSQPPPQYAAGPGGAAVPMEKYNQTAAPPQAYQQPYSSAQNPQPQYTQPIQQQQGQFVQPPLPAYNQQQPGFQYPQDPIPRQDTVSPISPAGYTQPANNASELGAHQQSVPYNPNASELSSTQPAGVNHYPSVSELSSPQQTGVGGYDYNVSELSTHK